MASFSLDSSDAVGTVEVDVDAARSTFFSFIAASKSLMVVETIRVRQKGPYPGNKFPYKQT